jgi:hypothetical protein
MISILLGKAELRGMITSLAMDLLLYFLLRFFRASSTIFSICGNAYIPDCGCKGWACQGLQPAHGASNYQMLRFHIWQQFTSETTIFTAYAQLIPSRFLMMDARSVPYQRADGARGTMILRRSFLRQLIGLLHRTRLP